MFAAYMNVVTAHAAENAHPPHASVRQPHETGHIWIAAVMNVAAIATVIAPMPNGPVMNVASDWMKVSRLRVSFLW